MFIPSLQKNIDFKPFTIEQFYSIVENDVLYPKLNLGFNIQFIKTVIKNCSEEITLTNFDKWIIGLQIQMNEIQEKSIDFSTKNITHPSSKNIEYNSYNFYLQIPTLDIELESCNYILQNEITDISELLLCEISKYINTIVLNKIDLNYPKNIKDRLELLRKISPKTLIECMSYIDSVKTHTSIYYTNISNIAQLKYSISLLAL